MIRYVELADGTLRREKSPLEGVPFFSDWLEQLLLRKAAFVAGREVHKACNGNGCKYCDKGYHRRIVLYTAEQEQGFELLEDGTIRQICIGCGGYVHSLMTGFSPKLHAIKVKHGVMKSQSSQSHYTAQRAMNTVRIGAVVQLAEDSPEDFSISGQRVSVSRSWRRRPVSKTGLGCSQCVQRYTEERLRVLRDNEDRRACYNAITAVYASKGRYEKIAELQEPKDRIPFLDVFSRSQE